MRKTDRVLAKLGLPIIMLAGILLIIIMVSMAKETSLHNNAYLRVIDCIVSHNPEIRTQKDINQCYEKVENQVGFKLQRYDNVQPK